MLYKLQVLFEWFGDGAANSRAMIDASAVAWSDLVWILIAFGLSMWLLTSALAGFEKYRLSLIERLLRSAAGIALLVPSWPVAGPAFAAAIALISVSRINGRRSALATSPS